MYLKSLELQGFKSFVEKTNIEFGNGITGIVGPNGSGKSNLSDAIRWVLGEQSAKTLRGGNMQDVIFAGTQSRKPLGFAEVSLVVDNRDHQLPVDYDEVVVTRRVFRSGESEYFLNKTSVRLKDIHELFMDTGVGRDGYSMIGQGKIAEMISAKAEDRRQMFEEAAGITKFRYRKEEAQRKIERTQDNIMRVSDIITELSAQLGPLEQQAERAKKFLLLRDELKGLDISLSLENIARYKEGLKEAEQAYVAVTAQLQQAEAKIAQIEEQTGQMFDSMEGREQNIADIRGQQQTCGDLLAQRRNEIGILNNRMEQNQGSIDRIVQELAQAQADLTEVEQAIAENIEQDEQLLAKQTAQGSAINELLTQQGQLDANVAAHSEETGKLNQTLIDQMNQVSECKIKGGNLQTLAHSYRARLAESQTGLAQKQQEYDGVAGQLAQLTQAQEQKQQEVIAQKDITCQHEHDLAALQKEGEGLTAEMQRIVSGLDQAQSRRKLLQDLEKSFDQYSRSVKGVMQAHRKGELGNVALSGTVAQLIQVENQYATAVEVALGASAQNIVTATESDAKKAIEYLKKTNQGRATFLPLSAARGGALDDKSVSGAPGYLGIAADLATFDPKYEKVITGLLGKVVVADTIDHAIAMAKKYGYRFRIVTLEGEMLAPGGSMSGGSRNKSASLFARANEIVALGDTIAEQTRQKEQLEQKQKDHAARMQRQQQQTDALYTALRDAEEALIKLQADAAHTNAFLQALELGKQAMESEHASLTAQITTMEGEIKLQEQQAQRLQQEIALLEEQASVHQQTIAQFVAQREALSEELIQKRMDLNLIEKDRQLQQERRQMLTAKQQEVLLSMAQKQQNADELRNTNEELADDVAFKEQQAEELTRQAADLGDQVTAAEQERKRVQDTIRTRQEELKEAHDQQLLLHQEQSRVEQKKSKQEAELDNSINHLWDEYELTVTTAAEFRIALESMAKAQRRINELRGQMRALGNVNVDAIEEYRSIKERYDFLTAQRDDLVEAQHHLEQVIKNMMSIMREQFGEKFKLINQYFGETFVQLFGGGKATLALTDPSDVLGSGVDINVQPPGKSLKNMMQLSGGEQAFVSIALLFAIMRVRPAPFCILDEIEAALDDVNVYRFADYLKTFAKTSQFVVVTHRRGTMEAANILYGVTMQERGVTKLLTLNIDEVVPNSK